MARRSLATLVIAGGGAGICLANDHYWQAQLPTLQVVGGGYPPVRPPTFGSVWGDVLLAALPFYALAVLRLVSRVRIPPVVFTFVALAALVIWEYHADHTTDSSTSSLVYLASVSIGLPIAAVSVLLDEAVRRLQVRRRQENGASG